MLNFVLKAGLDDVSWQILCALQEDARLSYSELGRRVASLSEVLECHHVTGDDCYILKVALTSVGHLERFLERLHPPGDTTTSVVLSSPVTHRVVGPDT